MSKTSVKESYVTPEVFSLEMNLEGVLCGSVPSGGTESGDDEGDLGE